MTGALEASEERPNAIRLAIQALISLLVIFVAKGIIAIVDPENAVQWVGAVLIGALSFVAIEFHRFRRDNIRANEKIFRNLVRTNAIAPDQKRRLCFTAEIFDDFPDESEFNGILSTAEGDRQSIDLVRMFAYQNLIMTPQYLSYLFFKGHAEYRSRRRVVVVDDVSQAALVYCFLSLSAGNRTFVISNRRFRDFVYRKCKTKGVRRERFVRVLKGNPSIVRVEARPNEVFWGRYTDFRSDRQTREIAVSDCGVCWELMERLIKAAKEVESMRDLYHLEGMANLLSRNDREEL